MAGFIGRHKKLCSIVLTVLSIVLTAVYLRAVFLPGIWHRDAFLYRQADGGFAGSDAYAEYAMNISTAADGAEIVFRVNDITNRYSIFYSKSGIDVNNVEIFENDELIFKGTARDMDGIVMLEDENGQLTDFVTVTVGGVKPEIDELFPGYTKLYTLAADLDMDTRGNPIMILFILIAALILVVDIVWEDFFFLLSHGLAVDGGTPSDYYLFMKKLSRVVLGVLIPVLVIMTFTAR
ncbi:MAG: hypothetical protein IJ365_08890 [Clostridia bacterium]|nr:hypothetical protein [Clostridia bacterium]